MSRKVFGVEWPQKSPSNGDLNTVPFVRMTSPDDVVAPE
jgi:hypothetical protein